MSGHVYEVLQQAREMSGHVYEVPVATQGNERSCIGSACSKPKK